MEPTIFVLAADGGWCGSSPHAAGYDGRYFEVAADPDGTPVLCGVFEAGRRVEPVCTPVEWNAAQRAVVALTQDADWQAFYA